MQKAGSRRRRFDYRGLITYLVLFGFLALLASGVVMFAAPTGRIARQIDWTLLGLDRAGWQTLHLSFAVIFVVMGFAHLACNWRGLLHHLRDRVSRHLTLKWELVLALLVTAWLAVSAVWALPPVNALHDWNEYFRRVFWADAPPVQGTGTPPAGGATGNRAPAITTPILPAGHPPIGENQPCSDCHRE